MTNNIACIIIAAGKGTRMKSDLAKVLHPVAGRPMIGYTLDLVNALRIKKTVVVVGHQHEAVRKMLPKTVGVVLQDKLLGTGDAVKRAMRRLTNFRGTVLVLYGDVPLLTKETITKLLKLHHENNYAATLLTAKLENPAGYGRIVRDTNNCITKIIEENEANEYLKEIKEVNTGIVCYKKQELARSLARVKPHNRKKEYYLTDTIGILAESGELLGAVKLKTIDEALGVNSQEDLSKVNRLMRQRLLKKHFENGVRIMDPETTFIDWGAKIGPNTVIYPFTVIENDVIIGKSCSIGPFCRLRPGTRLGKGVTAGNFIEISRSAIKDDVFLKHFSYVGDASIGTAANIGAGTVTANFDGKTKHKTIIGDRALIGSDTVLVAPVRVGRNARTGAGSVVVKNVANNTTVVGVPAKVLKKG